MSAAASDAAFGVLGAFGARVVASVVLGLLLGHPYKIALIAATNPTHRGVSICARYQHRVSPVRRTSGQGALCYEGGMIRPSASIGAVLFALVVACSSGSAPASDAAGTIPGDQGASSGASGGPGSCKASCDGKKCGDDGCGGACGTCGTWTACNEAQTACEATCDLPPLDTDRVLDVALKTAKLSGRVTVDGAPVPANGKTWVRLVSKRSGDEIAVPVGAVYEARVFDGAYSVFFDSTATEAAPLPKQEILVRDEIELHGSVALDLALTTAKLSGVVHVDGKDIADGTQARANVTVAQHGARTAWLALPNAGPAAFDSRVYTAKYDIGFDATTAPAALALPAQSIVVVADKVIGADVRVDLDLRTTSVHTTVTKNGAPLADATTARGTISFRPIDGSLPVAQALGTAQSAFETKLFVGDYAVHIDTHGSTANVLPVGGTIVLASRKLEAGPSQVALEVRTVNVSGVVKQDGHDLAAETGSGVRGLEFVNTPYRTYVAVPTTAAPSYAVELFAGTYDVRVQSTTSTVLPQQVALLGRREVFNASRKRDVDLRTAKVSLPITIDGRPLATSTKARGYLRFIDAGAAAHRDVTLGTTGSALDVVLYQSKYTLQLSTEGNDVGLPRHTTQAATFDLARDLAVAVQLKTLALSGNVTLDGQAPADGTAARGYVLLADKLTGSSVALVLSDRGATKYATRAYAGGFDIDFVGSAAPFPVLRTTYLRGCAPVVATATDCSASAKDLTGTWAMDFLGPDYWSDMTMTLVEKDGRVVGSSDWYYGSPIVDFVHRGSAISFTAGDYVVTDMVGSVVSGCRLEGHAKAHTGYTTDWVATRIE